VKPFELRASDPIIDTLTFQTYRYTNKRKAEQFLPAANQPQTIQVKTRWGGVLNGKRGDYLVWEINDPEERWVVDEAIFWESYLEIEAGIFVKSATVDLAPLIDVTRDPDREVIIYSLEGPLRVRAGDFYLAIGVKKEIWPAQIEHINRCMKPVE